MSRKPADALLNLADAMAEDILNTPDDELVREVEEDFGDPRALACQFDNIVERARQAPKPDALLNLADAMAEDILNTPDDELLREVEEDFGDKHALATQFEQMWERAKKAEEPTAQREALTTAQPDAIRTARPSRAAPASSRQLWLEWFSALFVYRAVWVGAAALLIVVILSAAVLKTLSTRILQVAHKVDSTPEQQVEQERVRQAVQQAARGAKKEAEEPTAQREPLERMQAEAEAGASAGLPAATSLDDLARLNQRLGRYAEAESLYKRSLAIRERALGPDHPDVATSLNNLARLYQSQRRYADAEALNERSLAISEKALGGDPDNLARLISNRGNAHLRKGNYDQAIADFNSAITMNPKLASAYNDRGIAYMRKGAYDEAIISYKEAILLTSSEGAPLDWAETQNNLGVALLRVGLRENSTATLEKAVAAFREAWTRERDGLNLSDDVSATPLAPITIPTRPAAPATPLEAFRSGTQALRQGKTHQALAELEYAADQGVAGAI